MLCRIKNKKTEKYESMKWGRGGGQLATINAFLELKISSLYIKY